MIGKITEYLALSIGIILWLSVAWNWILSGNILMAIFGLILILLLGSFTIIVVIREILYYAVQNKSRNIKKNVQ